MSIQPVNNHLLIQPVKQEHFIASQQETYEEIGVVINADSELLGTELTYTGGTSSSINSERVGGKISIGDKVYFDAWLAAKFPSEVDGEFYWLVKWEDIRAVEYAKPVSE